VKKQQRYEVGDEITRSVLNRFSHFTDAQAYAERVRIVDQKPDLYIFDRFPRKAHSPVQWNHNGKSWYVSAKLFIPKGIDWEMLLHFSPSGVSK
jgi:hypothetical protein